MGFPFLKIPDGFLKQSLPVII